MAEWTTPNKEIAPQSSVELLGVTIDNELKFDQHISVFTNQQDVSLMLFSNWKTI